MAKYYLTDIDTADGGDTGYSGFVKADSNFELVDNEIYAARGGQTNLVTRLNAGDTTMSNHAALTAGHGATGAIVGTTNTQTLTNKTLTSPVITSPTMTGANVWNLKESYDVVSGNTTKTFTGLETTGIYRLEYTVRTVSTFGYPQIRFNADTGANYSFSASGYGVTAGVSGAYNSWSAGLTYVPLSPLSVFQHKGVVEFTQGYSNTVLVTFHTFSYNSEDNILHVNGGGYYSGSANLSSLTFMISASTFGGGTLKLMQFS